MLDGVWIEVKINFILFHFTCFEQISTILKFIKFIKKFIKIDFIWSKTYVI